MAFWEEVHSASWKETFTIQDNSDDSDEGIELMEEIAVQEKT